MEGQPVIDALISLIGDEGDRHISSGAIGHLVKNEHHDLVLESLLAIIRDGSKKSLLRERAALALARMACPQASEPFYPPAIAHVFALLNDQDTNISGWMLCGLGAIPLPGNPMHPDLVKALSIFLDDANPYKSHKAVTALGNSKDLGVVPALIAKLNDERWIVRKCAVLALGKLKDARAINPIKELATKEYAREWILGRVQEDFEGQTAEPAPPSTPKNAIRISVSAPENASMYYTFANISDGGRRGWATSHYGPADRADEKMTDLGWRSVMGITIHNNETIVIHGDEQPSPELLQLLRDRHGFQISIRDDTPKKVTPPIPVSPLVGTSSNPTAAQVQALEQKSKRPNGCRLAVGGLTAGVGLLIALLFTIIQVTNPSSASNREGFILVLVLCPLPLLIVGIILLSLEIIKRRKARI
jgi:hypothetical protein